MATLFLVVREALFTSSGLTNSTDRCVQPPLLCTAFVQQVLLGKKSEKKSVCSLYNFHASRFQRDLKPRLGNDCVNYTVRNWMNSVPTTFFALYGLFKAISKRVVMFQRSFRGLRPCGFIWKSFTNISSDLMTIRSFL